MKDLSRMVRPKDAKINALSRLIDAGIIGCTLVALVSVMQLDWLPVYSWLLLIAIVLFSFFTESSRTYKSWRDISISGEIFAVGSNWAAIVVIFLAIQYLLQPVDLYNREVVMYWFVLTPIELISWHSIMRMVLRIFRDTGLSSQKVAIYGATELGVGLEKRIQSMSWAGYNFVGFFDYLAVINNLASLLTDQFESSENIKRAVALTERFADSEQPFFIDTYAWALVKSGLPQAAEPLLVKAVEIAPDVAVFHYHLGVSLKRLGRIDEAKKVLLVAQNKTSDKDPLKERIEFELTGI